MMQKVIFSSSNSSGSNTNRPSDTTLAKPVPQTITRRGPVNKITVFEHKSLTKSNIRPSTLPNFEKDKYSSGIEEIEKGPQKK